MRKHRFLCVLFICCMVLSACSRTQNNLQPTETNHSSYDDPTVVENQEISWKIDPDIGGYEYETDGMRCRYVVNDGHKYINLYFSAENQTIEFYASPTEIIILNTINGVTTYYSEESDGTEIECVNPMVRISDGFSLKDFVFNQNTQINGAPCLEYCSTETVERQASVKINYTLYTISAEWIDGKEYLFQYAVYEDGTTLVIGNAPTEITPAENSSNPWGIDTEKSTFFNKDTEQCVDITIIAAASKEGQSPSNTETINVTEQHNTYVYFHAQTQEIQAFRFVKSNDGPMIYVLHDANIEKPEVTEDMMVMDVDTMDAAIWLITMLDSMFL